MLKIKELREEFQLTQGELADKISNAQRNVSNWEKGTSEPDCATLVRLADVFGVTLDELFGREERGSGIAENEPLYKMLSRLTKAQKTAIVNLILSFGK